MGDGVGGRPAGAAELLDVVLRVERAVREQLEVHDGDLAPFPVAPHLDGRPVGEGLVETGSAQVDEPHRRRHVLQLVRTEVGDRHADTRDALTREVGDDRGRHDPATGRDAHDPARG